jgi:hypothetical protein
MVESRFAQHRTRALDRIRTEPPTIDADIRPSDIYTEAFTLTLLIVPLLTNVLKLAAARVMRQIAQYLLH